MDEDNPINFPSWFRLAKHVSKLSTHKRYHLGAAIVSSGKLQSVGTNRSKTDPRARWEGHGLHAEIVALKNTGKDHIKGASIFVYRERKDGSIGMAKPCPACLIALKAFGVRKIFYSTDEYPWWEMEYI